MSEPSPFFDAEEPLDAEDAELDGFDAPAASAGKQAHHDAPQGAPDEDVFGDAAADEPDDFEHGHDEAVGDLDDLHGDTADAEHHDTDAGGFDFSADAGDDGGNAHADPFAATEDLDLGHDEFGTGNQDAFAKLQHEQKQQEDDFMAGPTPLSIWEAERKKVLEDRSKQAKLKKEQSIADGKKEGAQFHKQREDSIAKNKTANRAEEKSTKTDLDQLMKNGTLWEKVARMANVQPKANQEGQQARMRKLLIQLKNDKVDENGVSKNKKK